MEKNIQSLILELINDESYDNVAFNYDSKDSIGHFEGDKNDRKYTVDISLTNNKDDSTVLSKKIDEEKKKEESTSVDSSLSESSLLLESMINANKGYNEKKQENHLMDIIRDAVQGYSIEYLEKKYKYKKNTIKTYIYTAKDIIVNNFCITPDTYNKLNVLAKIQYIGDLRRLGFTRSSIVSITNDTSGNITTYSILRNCDPGILVNIINDIINNNSSIDEIAEKYNIAKTTSKYARTVANKIKHKNY